MSSISGFGSSSAMMQQMQTKMRHASQANRPSAQDVFAKIDSSKQGFFDLGELQTAVNNALAAKSNTSNATPNITSNDVNTVFNKMDSDGDGKVTQQEFASTLSQLRGRHGGHRSHQDEDSANAASSDMSSMGGMQNMAMMNGMGGMPPPPPLGDAQGSNTVDQGFTADELKAQLDEIGNSDAKRSTLINNVLNNFSTADADGNGKVSFAEAMQLEQSLGGNADMSTTNASASGAATTPSTTTSGMNGEQLQQKLMRQIMKMMQAYGLDNAQNAATNASSSLSVTA
jgi:Ca2+-binding EF-hand superfamily protein